MAKHLAYYVITCLLLTSSSSLPIADESSTRSFSCPDGWKAFTDQGPVECLWPSRSDSYRMSDANDTCVAFGANLVTIFSEEKLNFVQGLMQEVSTQRIWLALTQLRGTDDPTWETIDGEKEMTFNNVTTNDYDYMSIYGDFCYYLLNGAFTATISCYGSNIGYICEKRAECKAGWYGDQCEKQCHCYLHECDSSTMICPYGCDQGWMGEDCSLKREKASVVYHCIKKGDKETYVSIDIDTKGIEYRNIHALSEQNAPVQLCNDIEVKNLDTKYVNIKIPVAQVTDSGVMQDANCTGKAVGDNKYEWRLAIQEWKDIVMECDQEITVTCDFSVAETLQRDDDTMIEGGNRPTTPATNYTETKEDVVLELADAATKKKLASATVGSPVILKFQFGLTEGSHVKSLSPYNCEAVSKDGTQRMLLLDSNGCQAEDSPVKPFAMTNKTNIIETPWFPYFAFDGSDKVSFHCSFIFCYDDSCNVGCADRKTWLANSRHVRSVHGDGYGHQEDVVGVTTL